jgi:hypothetical protein
MLIDLRELCLLFRQFEMWYMLVTLGEWAQCLHKSRKSVSYASCL